MSASNFVNFPQYVVRNDDDSVNLDATRKKFDNDLQNFVAKRELELNRVRDTLNTFLDQNKTVRLNVDYVVSQVTHLLGATPTNHAIIKKFVHTFLTENSKVTEGKTPEYYVPRGRTDLGVMRYSDFLERTQKENTSSTSVAAQ